MKKSTIRTFVIGGPLLAAAVVFYVISAGQDSNLVGEASPQESRLDNLPVASSNQATTPDTPARTTKDYSKPADSRSAVPALDFSYITSEYLKTHWEEELGCFGLEEGSEALCDYPELSASSYEEAIWMIENGYPTASELNELTLLSDTQLKDLSRSGYPLPSLLLAQRYAAEGKKTGALRYFLSNEARRLNPYSLQRWADSLIANADPNQPGMANVQAAINLKKAALLGDYTAEQALYRLYDSYWRGTPHLTMVTHITDTAHWELSRQLGVPQDQWATPRPGDG